MPRFRVSTSETLFTFYEIDIPDDVPPEDYHEFFYTCEQDAHFVGKDSSGFEIETFEEIKDDK